MSSSASSIDSSPLLPEEDITTCGTDDGVVSDDPRQRKSTIFCDASDGASHDDHTLSCITMYFVKLSSLLSAKFLSWLAITNCFCSSVQITAMSLPLFKNIGVIASRQQLYASVILCPWAMKPLVGVASDLFPILGFNKRYSALIAILVGLVGCSALLAIYPVLDNAKQESLNTVQNLGCWMVLCFTAITYESAALSILGEGKSSELMQLHPESGSSIITFKFVWSRVGNILVQSFVGPLSDKGLYQILLWILLAFSLAPLLPTLFGGIPETKRTKEDPGMMGLCGQLLLFDRGAFQRKKSSFIVITLCGLSAPLVVVVTTFASLWVGLVFSAVLIVFFCGATFPLFPTSFFKIFLAMVLTQMSNINISSALGYYYTASETCAPNGPKFDYTFFITTTGIVGSVMGLLSSVLYEPIFSSWKFRPVLMLTLVLGIFASLVDLIITMRWNLSIGIPDKVMFMLSSTILGNLCIVLQRIPFSAIFSQLSPPGMESAVFAYLFGMYDFCGIVTNLLGSGLIHWSGMTTIGEDCDFSALPRLIIGSKILVPVAIGIPSMFLIPNVLQTDRLINWEQEKLWQPPNIDNKTVRSGLLVTDDVYCIIEGQEEPHL